MGRAFGSGPAGASGTQARRRGYLERYMCHRRHTRNFLAPSPTETPMRRLPIVLSLALVLGAVTPSLADGGGTPATQTKTDVLTLKDGHRIEGQIVAEDDRFVSISSGGTTRAYARDAIASIERAPRPQPAPGADA